MFESLRGTELIIAVDFNLDLEKTDRRVRDEEIAAVVETAGLEDLAGKFLP